MGERPSDLLRQSNEAVAASVVARMRWTALLLFVALVVLVPLAGSAEAQCTALPSVTEAPVPAIALPGQANTIVARASAIEAPAATDPSRPQAMLELATAYRAMVGPRSHARARIDQRARARAGGAVESWCAVESCVANGDSDRGFGDRCALALSVTKPARSALAPLARCP